MRNFYCLVVEDSPMMRQLLTFALSRIKGLTVMEADDGVTGLKEISARRYDLIVIDINMPIMDGLKLIKHIRSDESNADVPIMVVSTEGSKEDQQRAAQLGVNVYLTKPVESKQIVQETKRLLGIDE